MSAAIDPVSNVAQAVSNALALALQKDAQLNTPAMLQAATAGALEGLRKQFAADEAALAANPTDPAAQAKEREEVS